MSHEPGPSTATQSLISRRDWDMIGLMLQEDSPRRAAALIYTKLRQIEQESIPADFDTDARWDNVCNRICAAAATGNADPTIQQSAHLLDVIAETAAEFEQDSEPQTTGNKRKSGAGDGDTSGPSRKKRKATEPTTFSTWEQLSDKVESLLGLIGRDIANWLAEEHHLPLWSPPPESSWHQPEYRAALDYISTLRLPRTPAAASGAGVPDLLLYKVGSAEILDPAFVQKKKEVKLGNSHKAVANVSGAGKSRMALEVLADEWSFYFMSDYHPIINPYGSQDVTVALTDMLDGHDSNGDPFVPQVHMGRGGDRVSASGQRTGRHNAEIAEQIFSAVLLARILVHDLFLRAWNDLPARTRDTLHGPKLWLLLQVVPVLRGRDIFLEVYRLVKSLSPEALETQISSRLDDWSLSNHQIARIGVDEIQRLVITYPSAFVGTPPQNRPDSIPTRPVFKLFVSTISSYLVTPVFNARFLFLGTRLSLDDAKEALISTAVKNVAMEKCSVTASHFDMQPGTTTFDPAPIIRYLSHFLTRSVVTGFGDLLRDIIFWLRGRPRFLAYFVQWVLQKGPCAARQVLLNMVSKLTGVELHICARPGEPVENIPEMQPRRLLSETLTKQELTKHKAPCLVIVQALLNLLIEGRYTNICEFHEILVEIGVGKFEESTTSCWIRENLVLARLFVFFATAEGSETFEKAINQGLRQAEPAAAGFAMENAMSWLFWQLFTTSTPTLASFLKFFGTSSNDIPSWANRPASLVWYFDGDRPVLASSSKFAIGLAAQGEGPSDTMAWLRNETRLPFFKPDKFLGPDVCFRVAIAGDDPGTYQIIIVCVQCKHGLSKLSDAMLREAVFTVTPSHFYSNTFTAHHEEVLESLPTWDADLGVGSEEMAGHVAIVRVLATTQNVKKFVDTAEGLGELPLATVTLDTFHRAVNNFQLSGFKAALEAADAMLAKSFATLGPVQSEPNTRRNKAKKSK